MGPADLIRAVCELTDYYAYLAKSKDQADHRAENVAELLTFATQAQDGAETAELNDILERDEGQNPENGERQRAQARAARIAKFSPSKKAQRVEPEVIVIDSDEDEDLPKSISVINKDGQKGAVRDGAEARPNDTDQPKYVRYHFSQARHSPLLDSRPGLLPCVSSYRTRCSLQIQRQTLAKT